MHAYMCQLLCIQSLIMCANAAVEIFRSHEHKMFTSSNICTTHNSGFVVTEQLWCNPFFHRIERVSATYHWTPKSQWFEFESHGGTCTSSRVQGPTIAWIGSLSRMEVEGVNFVYFYSFFCGRENVTYLHSLCTVDVVSMPKPGKRNTLILRLSQHVLLIWKLTEQPKTLKLKTRENENGGMAIIGDRWVEN